ncbi:phosphotransferase [Phycicoccus sp. BSK3Z-2]|uniref:Phosphotransferase n=1 Tax=Phycicoccus avicenniae TaxID=2828860 RepID=A0A941DB95_9MICO|nr:phosphotransferase [Phycicoccus avicenniae]MBR7743822.1 phosphotransferase [Phycicoccus avicenniae]
MERSPAFLAALAGAAVPGLEPVTVEAIASTPDQSFDVAFVQDQEHRRWVVRAPRTDVAGAEMDRTVALLGLLARRVPFAVPAPRGFVALDEGGRAAVYPFLPGHALDLGELPHGPGLAVALGRALAALHDLDPAVYEEAGVPTYDADAYRTRRLAELDRAAATGRVPTTLLGRWEEALEDVSLWRFAATPVHGAVSGEHLLAVFDDERDASSGRVAALTGWENAKVADPADDFAPLVEEASTEAVETVLEAYAHHRSERPDGNLLVRARLGSELGLLARLMAALGRRDQGAVEVLSTQLRRLDDAVHAAEDGDGRGLSLRPVTVRSRRGPVPLEDGPREPAGAASEDRRRDDDTAELTPADAGASPATGDVPDDPAGTDSGTAGTDTADEPPAGADTASTGAAPDDGTVPDGGVSADAPRREPG